MIAQLLLAGLLAATFLYASIAYRSSRLVGLLAMAAVVVGLFFVWFPDESTELAGLIGIGRGVDMITYIWIVVSFIVFLNIHLKIREQTELITRLARHLALLEADRQDGEDAPSPEAG